MPDLVVAGAGMAGLCAAARARELGASVTVLEKGDRAGGSMLLSSGVIWRYRDFERFRAECPDGDRTLQRAIYERLDDDIRWLESIGAPVIERGTGNPITAGTRFDPRGLTDALTRSASEIRLEEPLRSLPRETPVVLATGGFQGEGELVRRFVTPNADELRLRANRWSSGDALELGTSVGASLTRGMDEFYGRNMPAPPARVGERDFVPLQQLYARHATVENERGERYQPRTWSEIDVVQWTARQPRARAWYVVEDEALAERVRERTVGDMIEAARRAGGPVERRDGRTRVEVVPGITSTLGGLRIDARARAAEGLFACGGDAGGVSTGGYSSGLAAALVLGRVAAESAIHDS
jgi:succinate dehydrogenase/fumarate reductase flavoprotein subunit